MCRWWCWWCLQRWRGKLLVGSGSKIVEQVASWRLEATDALVAVGTDVVVAWQCSQRLVELADEQVVAGVDAIPPATAASSSLLIVSPLATARHGTARPSGRHERSTTIKYRSQHTSVAAAATGLCRRWAYPRLSFRHSRPRRTSAPYQKGVASYTGVCQNAAQNAVDLLILVFGTRLMSAADSAVSSPVFGRPNNMATSVERSAVFRSP